jgi:P pilus assembly chaperone PapD
MRAPAALAGTALFLAIVVATELVGIVVAPTGLYLGDADPAGVVRLYNPGTEAAEVSVEAVFGYPTTDEGGQVRMDLKPGGDPRSAAEWVQILPRRLVIPPGERRAVRVLARPPDTLPEGEYWTRLVVTSQEQTPPVSGADTAAIQVGLTLRMRTIIALAYRRGQVETGVDVRGFTPRLTGDSLVVWPELRRRGNGAYIGRMQLELVDADDNAVRSWDSQVAVYDTYRRRYAYDVSSLPEGEYRLALRLDTEREDIAPSERLASVPVELEAPVLVQ